MNPTPGRIVLYREAGGDAAPDYDLAAVVIATPESYPSVTEGKVNLRVFGATGGEHTVLDCPQQPDPAEDAPEGSEQELSPGCWRWPERV